MKEDLKAIKDEEKVIVAADKTRNYYKMEKERYKELLNNNITKDYKKVDEKVITDITKDDKKEAINLDVADRVYCTSKRDSFITIKDHKQNYMNNTKCRLINPCKSELGMISKQMLSKIIATVKTKSQLQQWKNSDSVIDWFTKLEDKQKLHFIQFDIVNFYGSITPELVRNALVFASEFVDISNDTKSTMMQATNSFLCSDGDTWIKKEGNTFDITMGGYHGAEVCDLCGLYILSKLKNVTQNIGLYRDDGLAVNSGSKKENEEIKKQICKVFKNLGLSITSEANLKIVNFLDITLDLNTGLYKPYMKDNDLPLYVNSHSNHPPLVIQNIPKGVNRRLSRISANKQVFDASVQPFQEALIKSGHTHKLEYEPESETKTKKRNRKKPVTWFNPPYSINVKSNIGKEFLKLLDVAFPRSNPLHKIFSRQTVKISYKCMPNMASAVSRHNVKILSDPPAQPAAPVQAKVSCNCRHGLASCPVQGKCLTDSVVYRASVTETVSGDTETYTGLTGNRFKERWYKHNSDMRNEKDRHNTSLSAHVWELKERKIDFTLKWDFIERAPSFNPINKKCRLCLKEKFHILYNSDNSSLNKRQEIFNTCRHRKQRLLENFKT